MRPSTFCADKARLTRPVYETDLALRLAALDATRPRTVPGAPNASVPVRCRLKYQWITLYAETANTCLSTGIIRTAAANRTRIAFAYPEGMSKHSGERRGAQCADSDNEYKGSCGALIRPVTAPYEF